MKAVTVNGLFQKLKCVELFHGVLKNQVCTVQIFVVPKLFNLVPKHSTYFPQICWIPKSN
jgi:hypothetical protein